MTIQVNPLNRPMHGTLYAAVPATADTLLQGMHPLTQPGVSISYYNRFDAAQSHVLQFSEDSSKHDVVMGVVCLVHQPHITENPNESHPGFIGNGTLPRTSVDKVYTIAHDNRSGETAILDTTDLSAQGYQTLVESTKMNIPVNMLQHVVSHAIMAGMTSPIYHPHEFSDARIERPTNNLFMSQDRLSVTALNHNESSHIEEFSEVDSPEEIDSYDEEI